MRSAAAESERRVQADAKPSPRRGVGQALVQRVTAGTAATSAPPAARDQSATFFLAPPAGSADEQGENVHQLR